MPRRDSLQDEAARKKRRQAEAAEERDSDQVHYPPLVSSLGNATDAQQRLANDLNRAVEAREVGLQRAAGVRVNHAVEAEAFTTGSDVFFRECQYCPGSADGGDRGGAAAR